MKNFQMPLLLSAAVLVALPASLHAQTFNAAGSSALFLELGEAAYSNNSASCAWSVKASGVVVATDTSSGSSLTDTGSAWVVWVPTSGNTCSSNVAPATVYAYLSTDSVVGNRLLFNSQLGEASVSYASGAGSSPSGLIEGSNEVSLPSAVANVLTSAALNAAGTDIRPEDAEFAITRALTPCGSTTTGSGGSIAPYLGLGYSNGSTILSHFSSKSFNVINFSLPAKFFVQPVGFDPIVVTVNSTDASGTGFNNGGTTTVSRAVLASYLDGSIGNTTAAANKGTPGTSKPTTVIVREPLSGTYNTMEFNIPNTRVQETSQDVGVNQLSSQVNCSGTVPASNPMAIENSTAGSWRYRAIGTGEELAETFATNDALGYGFWSVSNFASAPSTAKYLMVDNVDPILSTYHEGVIPTTLAELQGVTFQHIIDGTYPIWSLIRIVTVDTATSTTAKNLAIAAAKFSIVGGATPHPDFITYYEASRPVPNSAIVIERSHFAPPGISFPGSNGTANQPGNGGNAYYGGVGGCTASEAGGDVGGLPIPIAYGDQDYCTDTGITYGITGRRQ